jgi:F-type H+-transporting ATPase subunit epsilon
MPAEELDAEKIALRVKNAEEDLADADSDEKKLSAQQALDRLKELQAAL